MGYCEWANTDPLNTTYHDNEWGVPVHDDWQMFEHLTLEVRTQLADRFAQAGYFPAVFRQL